MQVGDLVREITRLDRKCSLGIVLQTGELLGTPQYQVHFFDDSDICWMSRNFLEAINNESR